MPPEAGYLYAIKAEGTPYVKIGYTVAPVQQRLRALHYQHPFRHPVSLTLLSTVRMEQHLACVEGQLHCLLEAYRYHGEWYEMPLTVDELSTLVHQAQAALTNPRKRRRPRLGTAPLVKLTMMVEPHTVEGLDRLMAKMQATHRSVRVDRSTAAREELTLGLEQAGCANGQEESPVPTTPRSRTGTKATAGQA